MNDLSCGKLGETWFHLVQSTVQAGTSVGGETMELLGARVAFHAEVEDDELIRQFGDHRMIAEMQKVFFTEEANSFGHCYANLMRGPDGRQDLEDVITLLRAEPISKRAVVTLCGPGHGKVPCINVVQFLVRSGNLETTYFARAQDAFKKFYADAVCLAQMARRVAAGLSLPSGRISGFIGSSHVYHADRPGVDDFLERGSRLLRNGNLKGAA